MAETSPGISSFLPRKLEFSLAKRQFFPLQCNVLLTRNTGPHRTGHCKQAGATKCGIHKGIVHIGHDKLHPSVGYKIDKSNLTFRNEINFGLRHLNADIYKEGTNWSVDPRATEATKNYIHVWTPLTIFIWTYLHAFNHTGHISPDTIGHQTSSTHRDTCV